MKATRGQANAALVRRRSASGSATGPGGRAGEGSRGMSLLGLALVAAGRRALRRRLPRGRAARGGATGRSGPRTTTSRRYGAWRGGLPATRGRPARRSRWRSSAGRRSARDSSRSPASSSSCWLSRPVGAGFDRGRSSTALAGGPARLRRLAGEPPRGGARPSGPPISGRRLALVRLAVGGRGDAPADDAGEDDDRQDVRQHPVELAGDAVRIAPRSPVGGVNGSRLPERVGERRRGAPPRTRRSASSGRRSSPRGR